MDAVEFVKKHGLGKAVELTREPPFTGWVPQVDIDVCELNFVFDDLKRLVESHELVSRFGGLKRAKRILKKSYTTLNTMVSVVWSDRPFQCTVQQLNVAITDVESCQ